MKNDIKSSNVWLPNQLSAVKLFLIQIECSINEAYDELDGKTLYEYTLINKDSSGILKILPELEKTPILEEYKKMLSLDRTEFLYQSVYKKTGGVLNLFHGEIKEAMDKQLKTLESKKDNNEAINQWKDMNSELWSGLSPELVWAGGGKVEKQLLFDFCKKLTEVMGDRQFGTEGSAVIKALEFLRLWQLTKNDICNDTPMNAIIKERKKIYDNKVKLLKEMNMECDF